MVVHSPTIDSPELRYPFGEYLLPRLPVAALTALRSTSRNLLDLVHSSSSSYDAWAEQAERLLPSFSSSLSSAGNVQNIRQEHASQQTLRGALSSPAVHLIKDQEVEGAYWIPAPDAAGPQLLRCSLLSASSAYSRRNDIIVHSPSGQVITHRCLTSNTPACICSDGHLLLVERISAPTTLRWSRYDWRKGVVTNAWDANDWCNEDLQVMLSPGFRPKLISLMHPENQNVARLIATDADTLQEDHCTVHLTPGSTSGPPSARVSGYVLSPDGTMAAALMRTGMMSDSTLKIMCVTTGACLASTVIVGGVRNMSWSPTLPVLVLRGLSGQTAFAESKPGYWIVDARNGNSKHIGSLDNLPGRAWWAPCGELLVMVTRGSYRQRGFWAAAHVYDVPNSKTVWCARWSCIDEGRDVSHDMFHPLSQWANPASWAGCAPHSSLQHHSTCLTIPLAFFHGARSLLRFQKDEQGIWTVMEQTIDTFATHIQPLLDPAGQLLAGAGRADERLIHEDLRSGERRIVRHASGQICSDFVHQLEWAPLLQGWRPLYACALLGTNLSSRPDRFVWSVAIVDAYAHQILHCWLLSDLDPEATPNFALSGKNSHGRPGLQWSSNARHLAVIGVHASVIVSFEHGKGDAAGGQPTPSANESGHSTW